MMRCLKLTWFSLVNLILLLTKCNAQNSEQYDCARELHQGCWDSYDPSPLEVERARIYLQDKFMKESSFPPISPPCPQLYVRRNFKCISHEERLKLIRVLQQLYANGFMRELADIHAKCWPPWHKSSEILPGHRWIVTKLELAMREIDPDVSIPYWIPSEDCVAPHESIIWQYFGTTGSEATKWCVTDGPFTEQTKDRCIKRQWNSDGTLSPWYCTHVEAVTYGLTSMNPWFVLFLGYAIHFHPHINIGGWNGQLSQSIAPYDFVFYPYHLYYTDCLLTLFQLTHAEQLTPTIMNNIWKFNLNTHKPEMSSLSTDTLCHYNTSVLETYHLGFGDQCWVCANVVQAINQKLNNESTDYVEKFTKSLPMNIRSFLDPYMSDWNHFQSFALKTPDPSKCNPECKPMPLPPSYTSDAQGRRQLEVLRAEWNIDLYGLTVIPDFLLNLAIDLANVSGYCSPYVTSINSTLTSRAKYKPIIKTKTDLPSLLETIKPLLKLLKYFIKLIYMKIKS